MTSQDEREAAARRTLKAVEHLNGLDDDMRQALEKFLCGETETPRVKCPVVGCARDDFKEAGVLRHISAEANKGDEAHKAYKSTKAFESFKKDLHTS